MNRVVLIIIFVLTIFHLGCEATKSSISDSDNNESDDEGGDADSDSDADADTDGFDDDDDNSDDDDDDTGDEVCEEQVVEIERQPTRLMILQDISGSMDQDGDGNPVEKWNQAKAALKATFDTFGDGFEVEFGVDTFPNPGGTSMMGCATNEQVKSDTQPDNTDAIMALLDPIDPDGATPLFMGMERFLNPDHAPVFSSKDIESYMLVVSDGEDTCGNKDIDFLDTDFDPDDMDVTPQELTDLTTDLLQNHEIKSVVIGFGEGANPGQLNAIAAAGGTEFDTYIDASNQQELEDALNKIITSIVSCVYELGEIDSNTADVDKTNIYFNDKDDPIGWDEGCKKNKGWDWVDKDKLIIEFCQEACDRLQNEQIDQIIIEFGCDVIVV